MKDDFQKYLDKQLENPEFRKEWESLEPEYAIMQALIDARAEAGITQTELSRRTGIAQTDISKLERGNGNPSLKTLKRLAEGLGMTLELKFKPIGT
jgi:DNA-binding XRE family transcriptional regulator